MNWKPAAVLMLVLGVGVGLYFAAPSLEKRWGLNPATEEKTQSDTLVLLHDVLNHNNVTQITVGEGADQFVLTRAKDDKNEWTLKGGWPTRDHETHRFVDSLTSLQSRFEPDKVADEKPDLASYGLDKPTLIVQVTAKDKTYRLSFGQGKSSEDANRFSKPTYLRVDDRPEVIRLAPGLLADLTHPAKYYEQRRLFPANREKSRTNASELENVVQAGAISITNRTKKEDLSYGVRNVEGEWQLDKPYRDRMEDAKFHPVLTALTDIWAEQFVDSFDKDQRLALTQLLVLNTDPLSRCFAVAGKWDSIKESLPNSRAEFGFEDPEGQAITLTTPEGKSIEVVIGKDSPAPEQKGSSSSQDPPPMAESGSYRYARLKKRDEVGKYYPVVFIIKYAEVQKNAFVDFQTLRDPSVRSFRPVDAIRVEVERANDKLVFEKNERENSDLAGSRWQMKVYRHEGSAAGWQSHESMDNEVETAKIDDLLLELSNLKAEKTDNKDDIVYQDDAKYGLTDQAIRVHVRVNEEEKTAFEPGVKPEHKTRDFTILLAAKETEPGKYYAKLDGFPRINRVRSAILPILQRDVTDFQRRKLFDWAVKQLRTVSVQLKDETVTLEQKDTHWSLLAPVQAKVDEIKASNLADQLSSLQAVEFLKSDEPDAKYGFDTPTATVVATFTQDNTQRTAKLLVGKQREDKPQYFARLEGRKDVLVLDKRFVDEVSQGSLTYRPLKFDKLSPGGIREIRIQKQKEKELTLAPQGATWVIRAPFQAKAQTGLAQTIADALIGLKAERYVAHKAGAEELERYGLKDPQFRVTTVPEAVGSGSNPRTETVLLIGKTEDKDKGAVYAKFGDDDAVFTISREPVTAIDVTPLALLNPRVLHLPPNASVVGFESHAGDKGLKLALKDNKWTVTESPAGSFGADPVVAEKLVITLRQLAVKEFKEYGSDIDWGKYDLKIPPLTAVVLTGKQPSKPQQIAFGAPVPDSKGAYYARIGDLPAVVVLDADTSATLRQGYLDFVNRQVLQDLKPDKVTKVQIRQGERSLVLEKKDAAWRIQAIAPSAADDQTIEDVLHELAALRAKRVAAFPVKEWKDYSSEPPAAVVKLLGDKEIELQIGKVLDEATGDRAAMVTGSNSVFVMSGDVAYAFVAGPVYFRDHLVARIRDEVDRVILENGGKKTVFVKIDGTWKRKTEGDDAEADHDELEEFVNSLSKLRADELFAEKPADLKAYGLDTPAIRWRLQAGDKDVLVLDVGKTAPEKEKDGVKQTRQFARLEQGDLIFVLDEKTTIRSLGRFRVRRIWPELTGDQIVSLKYHYGKESFSLTHAGRQWICSDAGVQVDPQRVEETLQGLANLKAERFVAEKATDLEPFGLKEPMLTIEIQTGKRKFELQLSKMDVDTGKYHARVSGGAGAPDVFLISYLDSMRLVRHAEDFAKLPPPIPPGGDR